MVTDSGCKVDIIVDRYDLDSAEVRYPSLDGHLYARWTGENAHQAEGYRTLTDWFNKQILRCVYDEHGRPSTSNRLANDYEVLTGDDDLARKELVDDVRADGITPENLIQDFVSWGTMRNHLKNCLDGEKQSTTAETEWEARSISIAKDFVGRKVREGINSLASKGDLDGGDGATIDVQVQLSCPECLTRVPFDEAYERGYVCKQHR